jgi:hypothetical protein
VKSPKLGLVENTSIITFDVDDTLVMHEPPSQYSPTIKIEYFGNDVYVTPNEWIINQLKYHANRGHFVIVWSQQGFEWVDAVIKSLNLEDYVNLKMSKPRCYYDDLPSQEWMGQRIWKGLNSDV